MSARQSNLMSKARPDAPRIRVAGVADEARVHEIMYGDPWPELVRIAGGIEQARVLGWLLVRSGGQTFVCELDSEAVGAIQSRVGRRHVARALAARPQVLRVLPQVYRISDAPGLMRRLLARRRVDFPPVAGAYHLTQLSVEQRARGRGVGTALLQFVEADARLRQFARISLTTGTANPARQLFERLGFRVIGEKSDRAFEKITGASGRLLMVKDLR
jgi:ribosomal protein S18 acetylase RimI-like enzyme